METDVDSEIFSSWFGLSEDLFHNYNEQHYGEKNLEEMPAFSTASAASKEGPPLPEYSRDGCLDVQSSEKTKKDPRGRKRKSVLESKPAKKTTGRWVYVFVCLSVCLPVFEVLIPMMPIDMIMKFNSLSLSLSLSLSVELPRSLVGCDSSKTKVTELS